MWKIETSGGLGQEWPSTNSWEKGKGEEEKCIYYFYKLKHSQTIS